MAVPTIVVKQNRKGGDGMAPREESPDLRRADGGGAEEVRFSRRSLLSWMIGGSAGLVAVVLGTQLIGFAASPAFEAPTSDWVDLGPLDSFQPGVPKNVQFVITRRDGWKEESKAGNVWVVRGNQGTNDVKVFNGHCTHLGCVYSWQAASHTFDCPCHGGEYTVDGRVIAGPPPRPLDALEFKVSGGRLSCRYQDFKLGVAQKVPV
jgi:Rieske Fe-S protein